MLNIRKVVVVKNYAISGSLFMQSLLDNHPQIISLPLGLDMSVVNLWHKVSYSGDLSRKKIFQEIKRDIPSFFNADYAEESTREMGESFKERLEVNEHDFFFHLGNLLDKCGNLNRRKFITAVFLAYNLCYSKNFTEDAIICLSAHEASKDYLNWIKEDFQEVFILHMIREQVQNMGSLMKAVNYYRSDYGLFNAMLEAGVRSIILDESIVPHLGVRINQYNKRSVCGKTPYFDDYEQDGKLISSRAVRLEDVHLRSKATMQKICDWLKIDWNDNLMKSTFMGKLWYNRSGYIRVSGFSNKIVSQTYSQYFNAFDRYRLKLLTKNEQIWFKYRKINLFDRFIYHSFFPLLALIPFKVEFNKERFLFRINGIFGIKSNSFSLSKEWIAAHYNKKSFRKELDQKIKEHYSPKTCKKINEWIDENHRRNDFTNKFIQFLDSRVSDNTKKHVENWIVNNNYRDISFNNSHNLKRADKAKIFLRYFPAIALRSFFNYRDSRRLILKIWKERLFKDDNTTCVKLLCDPQYLAKNN